MSAEWYYMKRRWLGGTRQVGPLSESDLLHEIDHGVIGPDTLLLSSKTKNRWVKMEQVAPAFKRWRHLHPTPKSTSPPREQAAPPEPPPIASPNTHLGQNQSPAS